MYIGRRRARRTVSAQLEMAMQSAVQEKISYSMAVRGLLGGISVMVHRMRAFAVPSEIGRDDVLVAVAAASANSLAVSLPGTPLPHGTQS